MTPRPGGVDDGDARAFAERPRGDSLLVTPGMVAGDGDIGGDGDVGRQAVGAGAGALEADLLLHGADRLDGGLDLLALEQPAAPSTIMAQPARLSRALPVTKSLPSGRVRGRW